MADKDLLGRSENFLFFLTSSTMKNDFIDN